VEATATVSGSPPDIIVINGPPCSGKSTLAKALQAALDEPWLNVSLDAFQDMLPPSRPGWPSREDLQRMAAGGNSAIAALADAGNRLIIELVVRNDNTGASEVLCDLFGRLHGHRILIVGLEAALEICLARERRRASNRRGLVLRDHQHVDVECADVVVKSDVWGVDREVSHVIQALSTGSTGGISRLLARLSTDAPDVS
jgi:chloramphenicol 3-O phosphotransferase